MKGHLILIPESYTRDDHAIALETLDLDRNKMHSSYLSSSSTSIGESAFTRLAYRRHPPGFRSKRNRGEISRRKKLSPLTPKLISDWKEKKFCFFAEVYRTFRKSSSKRRGKTKDDRKESTRLVGGKYENERIFQASDQVCPLFHSLWNVESFPSVEAAATTVKEQRRKKGYEESGATRSVAALSKVEQVYRMSLVPCILASKPSSTRFGISLLPGTRTSLLKHSFESHLPSLEVDNGTTVAV
ncbi:hypothetical protein V1478_011200 [Vespula squamosa]|uniref:Uncharacterized protein n=1 Tax=Vespula squamosa TaxID=30214 RepID=A0ABD2ADT4_VESSQ